MLDLEVPAKGGIFMFQAVQTMGKIRKFPFCKPANILFCLMLLANKISTDRLKRSYRHLKKDFHQDLNFKNN